MEELIKLIDLIHAEAIQTAERDKMMKPDANFIHEKHNKHIANIVKLRHMVNKAIGNMAKGEYYQEDVNAETNLDKLRSELSGHEGHEQELIDKGLLKTK